MNYILKIKQKFKSILLNKTTIAANNPLADLSLTYDQILKQEYKDYWLYTDLEDDEIEVIKAVRPFTMTSPERMISLIRAVKYIVKHNVEGDFVECGVWRGGSMMIVALVLIKLGITNKKIFLYDTFEGMSPPTNEDKDFQGEDAFKEFERSYDSDKDISLWCYSHIDEVKNNLYSTSYPKENIVFIKGKVEDTIPDKTPEKICLLRLDTDWYESTYHEMQYLYPIISKKGVLIIDDFGHWKGSRKAIEQYFEENNIDLLLNRIDYSGRLVQKM